jgi:hypothetical protein
MRLSIPEILQLVVKAPAAERVAVLQKHNSGVLRDILTLNFNTDLVWDLPEGEPPYTTNKSIPVGLSDSNLYNESRRLYICIKDHPKRAAGIKRTQVENIWIQILEGVHWTEAELLCQVKERQLAKVYKGLTAKLVNEAFPGTIPEKTTEK